MIRFRQKDFSFSDVVDSTYNGALMGGAVGSVVSGVKLLQSKMNSTYGKDTPAASFGVLAGGALIGAALGMFVGLAKELDQRHSHRTTVDRRLMEKVVDILKRTGYKEGEQFTRDPKTATKRKIKVCITISRDSGEVRVGVNTIADPKLKGILENKIRTYQNASIENIKSTDKFNDITISAVSDGSADAGFIAGIADTYIHAGYPVYLVEVG